MFQFDYKKSKISYSFSDEFQSSKITHPLLLSPLIGILRHQLDQISTKLRLKQKL